MPALKDQNVRPADENAAGWSGLCATGPGKPCAIM
jgi:hypothetical protein